jgi:hypothetical protein
MNALLKIRRTSFTNCNKISLQRIKTQTFKYIEIKQNY